MNYHDQKGQGQRVLDHFAALSPWRHHQNVAYAPSPVWPHPNGCEVLSSSFIQIFRKLNKYLASSRGEAGDGMGSCKVTIVTSSYVRFVMTSSGAAAEPCPNRPQCRPQGEHTNGFHWQGTK